MTTATAMTEATREIANTFLQRMTTGDTAGLLSLLDEKVVWEVMGHADEFPMYRRYRKDEVEGLLRMVGSAIVAFHGMSIETLMADGGKAAIEMHPRGENAAGQIYDNRIVIMLDVEDGRVKVVKEYLDTLHLKGIMEDRVG